MTEPVPESPQAMDDPAAGGRNERASRGLESVVEVALQGDPRRLSLAIALITFVCVVVAGLYFRSLHSPNVPVGLALLPGLAAATFASASFAAFARRRNAALRLVASRGVIEIVDARARDVVVDRKESYAAVVVADRSGGPRVVVFSQSAEPVMLLEKRPRDEVPSVWGDRVIEVDMSTVPLSGASPGVVSTSRGESSRALLAHVANDLDGDVPLLVQPLANGERLVVDRDGVRVGSRLFRDGETTVRRTAIATSTGNVRGISLVSGRDGLLLASHEGGDAVESVSDENAPDAFVSPVVVEIVASRFGKTSPR